MDINKPPIPLNIKLKALALITLIIASGFFDIVFPISFVSSIFILYSLSVILSCKSGVLKWNSFKACFAYLVLGTFALAFISVFLTAAPEVLIITVAIFILLDLVFYLS